jgi:outer membrane protein assembly factor BamB
VDPARHTAAVIGRLPEPLAGAAAVTVDGEVFVAGGDSPAARRPAPGLGTTQLSGQSGAAGSTVSAIWAFNPATRRLLPAGRLQVPVSHAAVTVSGSTAWIVGGESGGVVVSAVQMLRPDRAFGTAGAPGAGSPYFGAELLIADRGNNRLLVMDAAMHVVWRYPAPGLPRDPLRFYFPDDAFFTGHEYTPAGKLVWTVQLPISYPSDPQQLGPDRYLIADYASPGQILEFNREGTILYRYRAASGPGMLNHPSLAELLPSGVFMANDDYNDRMVAIDPATGALVWQYGITGKPGTEPGELSIPDGFDLLLPDGSTPTHPVTG